MTRYIIRRLLQAIPTLIGISIISFFLVSAAPGDPVTMRTFGDPHMTEATRQVLRRQSGAGQPLPLQYLTWFAGITIRPGNEVELMSQRGARCGFWALVNLTVCDTGGGVVRLDLGTSLDTKQPVWERMTERMCATIELGLTSLIAVALDRCAARRIQRRTPWYAFRQFGALFGGDLSAPCRSFGQDCWPFCFFLLCWVGCRRAGARQSR